MTSRLLVSVLCRLGCWKLVARLLSRSTYVVQGSSSKDQADITLLALSAEHFRGDLEALAALPRVRVVAIKWTAQNRLFFSFYPRTLHLRSTKNLDRFSSPDVDDELYRAKTSYRRALSHILPHIFRITGASAVLSYHVLFKGDIDWGGVSDRAGVPYIVLHREGAWGGKGDYQYQRMQQIFSDSARFKFEGSAVLVHTAMVQDMYKVFVNPDQLIPIGVPRMDGYLQRIRGRKQTKHRRVTFFPFFHSTHFPAKEAFRLAHVEIVRFAQDHPDVNVVIKPKGPVSQFRTWQQQFDEALGDLAVTAAECGNLTIRFDLNAQDLILASDVVCGVNSTTLLEAGIAGCHVVIPLLDTLASNEFSSKILFKDDYDAFDVAETPDQFRSFLERRLAGPSPQPDEVRRREAVFEKFVSPISGTSSERTFRAINAIIDTKLSSTSLTHSEIAYDSRRT